MSSATEQTSHGPEITAGAFERLIIVTDNMNDDLKCITTKERIYADKVPIATVETGWTGPVEGEQEKYLKLFAAAPDLYEALKNLMGLIDNPVMRRKFSGPFADEAREIARAAIKKAEGR